MMLFAPPPASRGVVMDQDAAPPAGVALNPPLEEMPTLLLGARLLVWWAEGAPLAEQATPMLVEDHIRLFAPPALTGAAFVPMHAPYDVELGRRLLTQLGLAGWSAGVVVDAPGAAGLSPAERRAFARLGGTWCVSGPTAATLHAHVRKLPVVGLVSDRLAWQTTLSCGDFAARCHALGQEV